MNKSECEKLQLSVEAFYTKSALEKEDAQLWMHQNLTPSKFNESAMEASRRQRTVVLPLQHHKLHQLPILERFKKLQRVFHPALCQYVSLQQGKRGRLLCVKEHVEQTLYTMLKAKGDAFSKEEYCSRILFRLLQGLQCCSLCGIEVRNLSLRTVGVDYKHDYKIDDYGLYYMTEYGEHVTFLVGDLAYFSPELVLSGKRTGKCSPANDLWSVGIIILSLLAEKPFCEGTTNAETVKTILKLGGVLSDEGKQVSNGRDARVKAAEAFLVKYIQADQTLNKNYQRLSESFKKIFHMLLRSDPQERTNASYLLSLPYFKVFHQNMDRERYTFQHIASRPFNALDFLPKIDFFSPFQYVNENFEEKSESEASVIDVIKSTLPDTSNQSDIQSVQRFIQETIKRDVQSSKLNANRTSTDESVLITGETAVKDVCLELTVDDLFLSDTGSKYDKLSTAFGIPVVPKDSLIEFIQCFKKQSKEIDIENDLVTDKDPLPIFSLPSNIPIEGTFIEDREPSQGHYHKAQDASHFMLTTNPFSVRTPPPPSESPAVKPSDECKQDEAAANADVQNHLAQPSPQKERSGDKQYPSVILAEKTLGDTSSIDGKAQDEKQHSNPFESSDDEQCTQHDCKGSEELVSAGKLVDQQECGQFYTEEVDLPLQLPASEAGSAEFEQRKVENSQRREQYLNTKFLDEISTEFLRNNDDPRFLCSSQGKVGRSIFAYSKLALEKIVERKKEMISSKEYETLRYRPKQTFRISSAYYELLGKEKVIWPALEQKEKNLLIDYQRYRADLFNELLRCYKANPFSFNDVKEEIIRQMKRQLPQTERNWAWSCIIYLDLCLCL